MKKFIVPLTILVLVALITGIIFIMQMKTDLSQVGSKKPAEGVNSQKEITSESNVGTSENEKPPETKNDSSENVGGPPKDNQEPREELVIIVPNETILCTKDNPNQAGILAYIQKNINPNINEETCYIENPDWDAQNLIMDISERVGDFRTFSGLVVNIKAGKVVNIINHLENLEKDIEVPEFNEEKTIEKAKKLAVGGNPDTVDEQTIIKQYDIDEKKFYIHVKTVFKDSEGLFYAKGFDYEVK